MRLKKINGISFHNAIAHNWIDGYANKGFRKRLKVFCEIFDRLVFGGETWVDLGCGAGILSKELVLRGASVFSVDGSTEMLESAKQYLSSCQGVDFIFSNVNRVEKLSPSSVEGIVCSSVIEYSEEPDVLLHEINRILKPNGKLIISLPPTFSLVRTCQKILRIFYMMLGKNKYEYLSVSRFEISPLHVNSWFRRSGFVIKHIGYFDPFFKKVLFPFRPALIIIEAKKVSNETDFTKSQGR